MINHIWFFTDKLDYRFIAVNLVSFYINLCFGLIATVIHWEVSLANVIQWVIYRSLWRIEQSIGQFVEIVAKFATCGTL